MLSFLFPNYKNFKVFSYSKEVTLEDLFFRPFSLKILKRSPSHIAFILYSHDNLEKPLYFLKSYHPRLFKRNRIKALIQNLEELTRRKVPLIFPLFAFYENPLFSFLKKTPFFGGVVFPYLERGFLRKEDFLKESSSNLLEKLTEFILGLHQKGILLGDTKYNNFYYTKCEGFKIFDLDGVKLLKSAPSTKERLKDLSALAMTLEWSGLKGTSSKILEIYIHVCGNISPDEKKFFLNCIEKKRKKRMKKLGLI